MTEYLVQYQSRGGDWSFMTVAAASQEAAKRIALACEFVRAVGKVLVKG